MSGLCHSPPLNRLALHREAKDERQIGQAKQVLVAMRKTQSYRNTKLRLIHKRSGMKWLEQDGFCISPNCQGEHWFRGYTVYSSAEQVKDLLSSGKPVSCFSLDGDHKSVHIAFRQKETRHVTVSYLTLKSEQARTVQNTGTHFCPFEIAETTLNKEKAQLNVTDYAIMLPLTCGTSSCDSGLYTLVYSDWHVLRCCEKTGVGKGPVTVDIKIVSDVSQTLVEGFASTTSASRSQERTGKNRRAT